MLVWLSFFLSLGLILYLARRSLWLSLIIGALILGVFNLDFNTFLNVTLNTVTNIPILLLALAIGMIPLIGGGLQVSGLLGDLVNNLQMKRQVFLGFSPALMGLLPIPGGALLSAPMLHKAGDDISPDSYASINVWFRHMLILIYPLGAILPCSKMANLNLYKVILYILPGFVILFLLGYFFFLFKIKGDMPSPSQIKIRKIVIPILIIVAAPFIHIILSNTIFMDEISLLIGISASLLLTILIGKLTVKQNKSIFLKMKPWKYFLIIIGIFLFLHVFQASSISEKIALIVFSKNFLIIFIAFFLGFVTGRVQVPISILLPIFLSKYGSLQLTTLTFAIMYIAVYIGYMVSPVHPCVSVSVEYFQTKYLNFARKFLIPCFIGLGLTYLAALILI